jgi:hypothetical protein
MIKRHIFDEIPDQGSRTSRLLSQEAEIWDVTVVFESNHRACTYGLQYVTTQQYY